MTVLLRTGSRGMKPRNMLAAVIAIAAGQTSMKAVVINLDIANWSHEKGSPEETRVHADQTSICRCDSLPDM